MFKGPLDLARGVWAQIQVLAERAIAVQIHDDVVLTGCYVQPLEHAVEVVHQTGEIAVDVDRCGPCDRLGLDVEAQVAVGRAIRIGRVGRWRPGGTWGWSLRGMCRRGGPSGDQGQGDGE